MPEEVVLHVGGVDRGGRRTINEEETSDRPQRDIAAEVTGQRHDPAATREIADKTIAVGRGEETRRFAPERLGNEKIPQCRMLTVPRPAVGLEAEIAGSDADPSRHGLANVCWIIRWPDRDARDEGYRAFVRDPGWQEIWSRHPNPDAYLEINVRFMRAATDLSA